jgi:hypothetical protein
MFLRIYDLAIAISRIVSVEHSAHWLFVTLTNQEVLRISCGTQTQREQEFSRIAQATYFGKRPLFIVTQNLLIATPQVLGFRKHNVKSLKFVFKNGGEEVINYPTVQDRDQAFEDIIKNSQAM